MDDSATTEPFIFTVPGPPAPFVRATGKQYIYQSNPAIRRYMDYRTSVGDYAGFAGAQPFTGVVDVEVVVYLRKPDKRRWDSENVLKACCDGMNGIVYGDDKQIRDATIRIRRSKPNAEAAFLYGAREWTVVSVTPVGGDPWEA